MMFISIVVKTTKHEEEYIF